MEEYRYEGKAANVVALNKEVESTLGFPAGVTAVEDSDVVFQFETALTAQQEAILDSTVEAHDPSDIKHQKPDRIRAIDQRTTQLIDKGFEFPPGSGVRYSLSVESQSKLLGMDSLRDDPLFTYPVVYNSIDDLGEIAIPDSATIHSFFLMAVGTYRAHLDSGTALKAQIRAATTQEELDAVVDDR